MGMKTARNATMVSDPIFNECIPNSHPLNVFGIRIEGNSPTARLFDTFYNAKCRKLRTLPNELP